MPVPGQGASHSTGGPSLAVTGRGAARAMTLVAGDSWLLSMGLFPQEKPASSLKAGQLALPRHSCS